MRGTLVVGALFAMLALGWIMGQQNEAAATAAGTTNKGAIAHNVYFALKEKTSEARAKLVAACRKYLAKHDGVVFFAAGTLAEELKRPVNDLDFDVGLHIVFKDMASHDKYQDAKDHITFIEENKAAWEKVRVFDSVVELSE